MTSNPEYKPRVARSTHSIDIRGIEYSINEWGEADSPPFFYLHGWADTGSTFQFVVDELSANWRVIAPDWRGFGRTRDYSPSFWFADYLADLHALLAIYSPDAPARIVGHSMGANVASLYAGTMPERVSAFINIEGFGLPDSDPGDAPERYREWLLAAEAGPEFSVYADMQSLAKRIRKRSPALSESRAEFVAREWAVNDGDAVHLRASANHKLPNPVLYRRAEAEACWRRVEADVLLVTGESSLFPSRFGNLADLPFPNARSTAIAAAGHMIHFEAPQALAEEIERFLTQYL